MTCPGSSLYLACGSVYVWGRGATKGVFQFLQLHYAPQQMSNFLGSPHVYHDLEESNCGALQEKGNMGEKNKHGQPRRERELLLNNLFPGHTWSVSSEFTVVFSGICCQHITKSQSPYFFFSLFFKGTNRYWFTQIKKQRMKKRKTEWELSPVFFVASQGCQQCHLY